MNKLLVSGYFLRGEIVRFAPTRPCRNLRIGANGARAARRLLA